MTNPQTTEPGNDVLPEHGTHERVDHRIDHGVHDEQIRQRWVYL